MRPFHEVIILTVILAASATARAQDEQGSPDAGPPVELTPPRLIATAEAQYPARALAEGVEADVVLEIDIDAEGQVEGVTVAVPADPAGYGFDDAALEAANLFEFEPAREGETPVPVRITYRYRFSLGAAAPVSETPAEEVDAGAAADAAPTSTAAPAANFVGELVERGTRLPLVGVTVTIFRGEGDAQQGFEALTDEEGNFAFYDLKTGEWKINAEPEGYFPLRTREEITEGQRVEARYYLERGDYNPYDVLVEGEQTRKEVSRTTLAVEQIEKIPGTNGDVLKVVQNFPGVARSSPISGDIIVRGSSPEDTEVFVDGVSVPIIYHFGGARSVIPSGMLERVDFYPGNFSVHYGRATGGVVDVGLKDLRPEKVGGYLDVNLYDTGVYLEVPIGDKAAVAVAGRRSYIDAFLGAAVPDDAPVNLITAPRYYDYQLLGSYRPAAGHELKAFFFGSDDKLEVLFDNPADLNPQLQANDATTSTRFYRTLLEYEFTPSEKFSNELKISGGRNWIFFGLGDQIFLDINSYTGQVRDTMRLKLSDAFGVNLGLDYVMTRADTRIKLPSPTKEGEPGGGLDLDSVLFAESPAQDFHSVAGFVELEARFFDRLLVVPGVRLDYFSQVDEVAVSPRVSARLQVHDQWTLKGGVGLFNQEPFFDETDPTFGNPELGLESAVHTSFGVEYRPLPHLTLDVTGFYKDLNQLVSRTEETVVRDGEVVPLNYVNGGEGRVYGMELLVRHDLTNNFTGWLGYTLSRSERKDFGADDYRLFDTDQTHILTVLGTYDLPRNWSLGFRWRLVSGNPSTPRDGSVFVVDDGTYAPVPGETNSRRMPPFHQLDIRVDKRWVFDNWMLTAYLDLQNVYNRANPVGYSYNYDSSERKTSQSLPIIPIIGLKGEF